MRRFLVIICGVLSGGLALVIAVPRVMPARLQFVPIIESVLPWLGWLVPILLIIALFARSVTAVVLVLIPAVAWALVFGGYLLPRGEQSGGDLRVATFNVGTGGTADEAAQKLASEGPDLVALQELAPEAKRQASAVMDRAYKYHHVQGTVGLWSRWPLREIKGMDLGIGWDRGLRATVRTPKGDVTALVMHAASVRPGETSRRDRSLRQVGRAVEQENGDRLVLLGDLNASTFDPRLRDIVQGFGGGSSAKALRDAQLEGGSLFGFTWPARFPVTRPDQILLRGVRATDASVERLPGSDHYAALADLTLP